MKKTKTKEYTLYATIDGEIVSEIISAETEEEAILKISTENLQFTSKTPFSFGQ